MLERENCYLSSEMEHNDKTYDESSKIIKASTSRVNVILLDTSDISDLTFNPDSNEALYNLYPTIADKVSQSIAIEKEEIDVWEYYWSQEYEAPQIVINNLVAIHFDFEGMKEKGFYILDSEKLNYFDRIVLDAITSLYVNRHNEYITPSMIFHVMAGRSNKGLSTNYDKEISNSITKLMFTHIIVKIKKNSKLEDCQILPAKWVRAKLNGFEVDCIHIEQELPLYLNAKGRNQIHEIDLELVKKPFDKYTREHTGKMKILFYLLRKIIALNLLSKRIKYDKIYHNLEYDNTTRMNKFHLRKKIKEILDVWKGLTWKT